ncbi:MAG: flagellar hook-basal body complex protein [Helicobacteraceae bacterium]|jgi:flagellar hook protein FlgE|nr:flagellar hook-basal body complex protein [Helicobacteraceae bacterium]
MMRSLFSGVAGLVSHQVAMDVEGNNIANVNTVGFKYSRTNFNDSLLQTMRPSTAPQGELGGRNATQIGSGVSVATVQRIHLQGMTQQTDVATDMAINEAGFFIVSADGGKSYYYTRAGNFAFDANGNLVNPNGLIVQGWIADDHFNVDSSMGIKNITIDPAMTVPAQASSIVRVSANLNSGLTVSASERSPSASTINAIDDIGALYSYNGEPIALKRGTDVLTLRLTRTYDAGGVMTESSSVHSFTYGGGTTKTDGFFLTVQDLLDEINARIKDSTGVYDNKVLLTGDGQIAGAQHVSDVLESMSTNAVLNDIFEPIGYGSFMSRSFKSNPNAFVGADIVGELFDSSGEALKLKSGDGLAFNVENLGETRKFVYREPSLGDNNAYLSNNFQSNLDVSKASSNQGFHWTLDSAGAKAALNAGDTITFNLGGAVDAAGAPVTIAPLTLNYGKTGNGGFTTIDDMIKQVNVILENAKSVSRIVWDDDKGVISDGGGAITGVNILVGGASAPAANTPQARLQTVLGSLAGAAGTASESGQFKKNDVYYFTNMQELVNLYQDALDDAGDPLNFAAPIDATVYINNLGQIAIRNNGASGNFTVDITGYSAFPKLGEEQVGMNSGNAYFTKAMGRSKLPIEFSTEAASGTLYAASFRAGVEVYDSSGAKHQLVLNFRKESTSVGNNQPTVWKWYVDGSAPTTFNYPTSGEIRFNLDGSVLSYTPSAITVNPNTGSATGQVIRMDFGDNGTFDRLTSFAQASSVRSGTGSDGYAGGFLKDISVTQTGMLVGEFSNGRQFDLGQVALATFVNEEGLKAQGGNLFTEAPNSGQATIGVAGTANRGDIAPSYLEMSNVDLSKALTNLIIIQRGYQASSKTITTSDQLLNTLLQLKQ